MAQIKRNLISGSISKNLISFAFPVFLSCLLQALYGNVDAMIVGKFSDLGNITGVTQGSQLMNIVTQMISGLSTGASVLISQYVGSKKNEDLHRTVSTVFSIFIVSALAISVLMMLGNKLFISILSVSPEAAGPFLSYALICEIGLLFVFLYNCISAVLQAMGDSRHPLLFVGIACLVNVFLDLVFVAKFGMGAKGAAIATVVAQLLSVVFSIVFLNKNRFSFGFRLRSFSIDNEKAGLIFKLGSPYMVQRFLVYSSFLAISGLSNPYGLEAGSAAGIVSKTNNFATIPFSAFNIGVSTVAAQCLGAGDMGKAKQALSKGFGMCFAFGAVLFLIVQLFPRPLISAFSSNEDLIAVATPFLKYYSVEYLLMPLTWTMHGFFSANGHTLIPSIDGIIASLICRTPFALLFSRVFGMGFNGIALGSALAVVGAIIPALFFYFRGTWKKPVIKIGRQGVQDEQGI